MISTKASLAAVIAIIVLVAIAAGWAYLVFIHGSRTTLELGGNWEIEIRSTPMSHGGEGAKLYRRSGRRRLLVDEPVYTHQYYGDDCVVYETTRGAADRSYYGACGDRQPVLLGERLYETQNDEPHLREYRIDRDGLAEIQSTSSQKRERKVSAAAIKRRALAQPPLTEKWYSPHP